MVYVAEYNGYRVRVINVPANTVSTLAGDRNGKSGTNDGRGTNAKFSNIESLALSPDDRTLYVADSGNNRIRKVDVASGLVSTLAGANAGMLDGVGTDAQFDYPSGISLSSDGKILHVADRNNGRVRAVNTTTGAVSSLTNSVLGDTGGVATSPDGSFVYVSGFGNHRISRVNVSSGEVAALAGNGTSGAADGAAADAMFNGPWALAIRRDGSVLYVVDNGNAAIRAVDTGSGAVSTLAWNGADGSRPGAVEGAGFSLIWGVAAYCPPPITTPAPTTTTPEPTTTPAPTTTPDPTASTPDPASSTPPSATSAPPAIAAAAPSAATSAPPSSGSAPPAANFAPAEGSVARQCRRNRCNRCGCGGCGCGGCGCC